MQFIEYFSYSAQLFHGGISLDLPSTTLSIVKVHVRICLSQNYCVSSRKNFLERPEPAEEVCKKEHIYVYTYICRDETRVI